MSMLAGRIMSCSLAVTTGCLEGGIECIILKSLLKR